MKQLLSTKVLSPQQKGIIESAGIRLDVYNAIDINFEKINIEFDSDYYIFTSQNAVRGFLRALDDLPLPEKRKEAIGKDCFSVGLKTSALLEENGLKVVKTAKNSRELGDFIVKFYQNASFLFFCGNRRRAELPAKLNEFSVVFSEIITYHTIDNRQKLNQLFDGVLFYSPSGVQSFTHFNDLSKSTAYCIGESTAREASRFTDRVIVAKDQSIESVLQSVLTHLQPK